jgi:aquaporin related protein
MLAILLLAAEKSRVTYQAPLPIGLALFISQLASGAFLPLDVNLIRHFD